MAFVQLGADNKVLKESLQHKLGAIKKEPCDCKLYDFDDVFYRIYVDPNDRTKMLLSVNTPAWEFVGPNGSKELIQDKLGKYIKDFTDKGCDFEIEMDAKCSENADEIGNEFSKLRILTLGGPLYQYCVALSNKSVKQKVFECQIRHDTYMWIVPKKDRLAIVYGFEFNINTDKIIANQILSEFVEVRRQKDVSNTPVVSFGNKPPGELNGCNIPNFNKDKFLGYFTILLLQSHVKKDKIMNCVENVVGFRSYLTYHIKCAKAFFHQSMRARVKKLQKVMLYCIMQYCIIYVLSDIPSYK